MKRSSMGASFTANVGAMLRLALTAILLCGWVAPDITEDVQAKVFELLPVFWGWDLEFVEFHVTDSALRFLISPLIGDHFRLLQHGLNGCILKVGGVAI